MAAALPARAELRPADLEGRWVTSNGPEAKDACPGCGLVLDLVPCGNGWCGIRVKSDKTCDRTVLHLDAGSSTAFGLTFAGRYVPSERARPYIVKARLYERSGPGAPGHTGLSVHGSTDGDFLRRNYPLQMLLTRTGDAVCRAEAKTS